MKIILDAMGGDNAPLAPLAGAAMAVAELGIEVVAVGDEGLLKKTAEENGISLSGISFCSAEDVIAMEDDATDILKKKLQASMGVGLRLLASGGGDAFVSAGSTGALLVGATAFVKRIKGVKRAALATVLPGKKQSFLLLDCGANVECRPEMLLQFGLLGSAYMQKVMDRKLPKVALANNGTEPTKGTEMIVAAYELMKNCPDLCFEGNIEARDIPNGEIDVVVADGFTGNIILKLTEGLGEYLMGSIKNIFMQSLKTKVAALLVKDALRGFKASVDYTEYGGAPLLGIAKPVIKAHGSSNAKAFKNALRQAKKFVEAGTGAAMAEVFARQKDVESDD